MAVESLKIGWSQILENPALGSVHADQTTLSVAKEISDKLSSNNSLLELVPILGRNDKGDM
jgi:hypothetical protein